VLIATEQILQKLPSRQYSWQAFSRHCILTWRERTN